MRCKFTNEFEDLAKQFSEDKSSSSKGGVLNRFGSGQLSSEEFENVAFNLTKENPVSEPFKSQYGWHIVKLIDKFSVKTLDEMRSDLESKVSKDDRSRLITASMNEKLRKESTVRKKSKNHAGTRNRDVAHRSRRRDLSRTTAPKRLALWTCMQVSDTDRSKCCMQ